MDSHTSRGVEKSPELSARALTATIAAFAVATIIVAIWLWQSWGGDDATRIVADVASLVGAGFATVCAVWAARNARIPARRRGWWSMAAGLAAWAVGAMLWIYHESWLHQGMPSSPSVSDAALLLFPVGAAVALLWLSAANTGQSRVRLLLDAVIIAAALFVTLWVSVLRRSLHAVNTHGDIAVWLTYLIADVVIVALAMMAWAGARPACRPSFALLAVGIGLMGVANLAVTYLTTVGADHPDNFVDLTRFIALVLIGLAALWSRYQSPRAAAPPRRPISAPLWLPYLSLPVTVIVWFAQVVDDIGPALLLTAVVLIVAVLSRQFVVMLENQRLVSDISRLAFRDPLTGVANRALFIERLEHAVARHRREHVPLSVLCLDLDDFKTVNDELGHPAGDELLIRVAGRILENVRGSDTVARLGGDEFAVLVEGSADSALQVAERVLDAFDSPIEIDGVALTVRPSIGVSLADGTEHITVDTLMRDADLAMYAAKRDGGGCLRTVVHDRPYPNQSRPSAVTDSAVVPPPAPAVVETAQPAQVVRRGPPRVVWPALAALLVGVLVFAVSTLLRAPGRNLALDGLLYSAITMSAAVLVGLRGWRIAEERWAWLLISAGMASFAFGDAVYSFWVPEGQMPSLADAFYLALYPFVYAGLLVLMRTRLQGLPSFLRLDAVIVGLTLAAVGAALAMGPVEAATGGSTATVIVGLAYPIGDLLLLVLAAGMLPVLGWHTERRWAALAAGFALYAIADTFYLFETAQGTYLEGTWIDVVWPAAALLVVVAAWLPTSLGMPRAPAARRPVVRPVMCTLANLGVLVFGHDSRLGVLLAVLGLTTLAARYAVVLRDVSAQAEKHQQAMTDELTGLANRRALATTLTAESFDESVVPQADRVRHAWGLLVMDLDQFKEINDSLGRHVGDELLCRIAERLAGAVRRDELLARIGGDEFALLLAPGAELVTARARAGALLEAIQEPFALAGITVQVDARIAIAMYPDHCGRPEELLSRAEAALGDKRSGVGRIKVYDPAVSIRSIDEAWLIEDLTKAFVAGELICHYQPKLNHDDQVHSVEALVRWRHPTRGLLMPDQFLPSAVLGGLMRSVTTCVLDIALAQLRAWRDQGIALTVAVNLSTTNLLDVDLVDTIDRLLRTHRLPAEALILEITESMLTTDSRRARKTLAALRTLGLRLSLDDYGTGRSSLVLLQDLSVDELKLDKVFVARLARDQRSIAIVRSTVALAHSLGADLVAEGVEDVDTLASLRQYGCSITQGNVHTPPLPADQLQAWLTSHGVVNLEVGTGVG